MEISTFQPFVNLYQKNVCSMKIKKTIILVHLHCFTYNIVGKLWIFDSILGITGLIKEKKHHPDLDLFVLKNMPLKKAKVATN